MQTQLSKTLSYLLRHHPEEESLDLGPQGFVDLDTLLEVLRDRSWPDLDREEFIELLDDPDVERFERKGSGVRATYGHSVEVDLDYKTIDPEFPLFHGTTREAWLSISEDGLRPMSRQYVHLSYSVDEARRVGRRRTENPVILKIAPCRKTDDRVFYRAGPVVLTKHVPSEWIDVHN